MITSMDVCSSSSLMILTATGLSLVTHRAL